jgi:phospholipase/carboxylesterase
MHLFSLDKVSGPHASAAVFTSAKVEAPTSALVLLHGRGASAADMLGLASMFDIPERMLVLCPQANGHQWYPQRFLVEREQNQPYLDSAYQVVSQTLEWLDQKNIPANKVILGGFSQGACLASDFIARNPKKYGGALILSGGMIGSEEELTTTLWSGKLEQTPVFLGCDVQDFHIPAERVKQTVEILTQLDADVQIELYEHIGHTVTEQEVLICQDIIHTIED